MPVVWTSMSPPWQVSFGGTREDDTVSAAEPSTAGVAEPSGDPVAARDVPLVR